LPQNKKNGEGVPKVRPAL